MSAPHVDDPGGTAVLVSGRRAGRLLMRELVERSGGHLAAPRLLTSSTLIESFFRPIDARLPADQLASQLVWGDAVEACTDEAAVLFPGQPRAHDVRESLARVRRLRQVCEELDAVGMRPNAVCEHLGGIGDEARWQALDSIREEAHRRLATLGLAESTVLRRGMIEHASLRDDAPHRLLVLALTDPGPLVRAAMDALGSRCELLVDAPESEASSFDGWGRPIPEAWNDRESALDLNQVELVDRPIEAAEQVLSDLSSFQAADGPLVPGRVVVGLCDEGYSGDLERAGRRNGVPLRSPVGRSLLNGELGGLLSALLEQLIEPSTDTLASLLRVPAFEAWLGRTVDPEETAPDGIDLIGLLDRWRADRVGATLEDLRLGRAGSDTRPKTRLKIGVLRTAFQAFEQAVEPMASAATIADCTESLIELLRDIFSDRAEGDLLREDFAALIEIIEGLRSLPAECPVSTGSAALLELILSELARRNRVPAADPGAIELLGWLELRHEPAREIILVGVNEAGELAARQSDTWLPDSLRLTLGLPNEAARHARDVHAMHVLAARTPNLRAIVSRHDGSGDPIAPSRLLLGAKGRSLADRVRVLFEGAARVMPSGTLAGTMPPAEKEGFPAPRPTTPPIIDTLSVTDFSSWIRSPMDHWLQRLEHLDDSDPSALELDARRFGTLAHLVVEALDQDHVRDSSDPKFITRVLIDRLDELVQAWYGLEPTPAIAFQRNTLATRLRSMAYVQARSVRAGWRIEKTEFKLEQELEVPGSDPVLINGRIDRIDRHESGRLRLLDYKTSERPVEIAKKRKRDGTWNDLQLPLYDHLYRRQEGLAPDADIELGYVSISADPSKIGVEIGHGWDSSMLDEAIDQARDIVRAMRSGDFSGGSSGSTFGQKPRPIDRILRTRSLELPDPHGASGEEEVEFA